MNQCVPSWELDEPTTAGAGAAKFSFRSTSNSTTPSVPTYEVTELTWENGQLAMHGLGPPRSSAGCLSKYNWDKPRANGTLESLVNQATFIDGGADLCTDLVPWFTTDHPSKPLPLTMDALVPCSNRTDEPGFGTCVVGCSTGVDSCSGANNTQEVALKLDKVARVNATPEWSSRDQSVSGSATFERESSQQITIDTYEMEFGGRFTSTSTESPENTSSGKDCTKATTTDDHDSVCHSRPKRGRCEEGKKKGNRKSSISTKRSRAAITHNQSERKRREKINQRMKTLQKMVPNSSKTDKASMLDEVIEYLKQLQAQVQMMTRMNMPSMMLPLAMQQQQFQMSMMSPMGMGMGLGMGMGMNVMDLNSIACHNNIPGIPPVMHPSAFMPMASWDGSGDRLQAASARVMPDPFSTFLACQSHPMTMDAYSRLAAMYQQLHQQPHSGSKS